MCVVFFVVITVITCLSMPVSDETLPVVWYHLCVCKWRNITCRVIITCVFVTDETLPVVCWLPCQSLHPRALLLCPCLLCRHMYSVGWMSLRPRSSSSSSSSSSAAAATAALETAQNTFKCTQINSKSHSQLSYVVREQKSEQWH